MEKIDKLTDEQYQQMIAFREEWRKIGLATGKANLEAMRLAINNFYASIDKKPPILWRCRSPLEAQLIINILKIPQNTNLYANLGENLYENLDENLGENLRANLYANLWENLGENLDENLGENLRENLWENLRANLYANLCANLRENLRDMKLEYIYTSMWGSLDSHWIAYYLFPHLFLREMHTKEQMKLLEGWMNLAKNAFWIYPYEGMCFICDRPEEYNFDEQWRLHNPNNMAVRFSDGYGLYAIHGVMLPTWIFEHPDKLTIEAIGAEKNVEIRRVMIERYGQAKYLLDQGAKLIHSDGYGDLYSINLLEDESLVMVKVINSTPESDGSYKDYFVRVPPDMMTAEQAVAWLGELEVGKFEYVQQS